MTDKQTHDSNTPPKDVKHSAFAHLKASSSVAVKKHSNALIGVIMGLAVVFFILFIVTSHHHRLSHEAKKVAPFAPNNALILKENEARLKRMQTTQPTTPHQPNFHTVATTPTQTKAMKTRENAPTQMYSMQGRSGNGEGVSAQTAHARHAVLVGTNAFAKFANTQNAHPSVIHASTLAHPQFTIAEGEFIHGVLETAINSDLPGMVRAVIDRPVYAYVGARPLIPAGSRLIGQYASLPSNGIATRRVFVVWNRIITPKGISIMINSPGTDALGRAGVGANAIDTHFFKMFGTAALLSVMSATTTTTGVSSSTQPNSANQYQQSISQALQQASQNSLSQNRNIKPTLHVYQGHVINVFVAHDVDLYSVLAHPGGASAYGVSNSQAQGFIK